MKTSNTFSIKRVGLLTYRHVFSNLRPYLMYFAAAGSILIIISLLNTLGTNYFSEDVFISLGEVILFIGEIGRAHV